jgi:hypothetical protein
MVTAAVVDGAASPSSGSARDEEAEGLQVDTVSMSQYQHIAIQQGSKPVPGRFEFLRLSFAYYPMTLWHQGQGFG